MLLISMRFLVHKHHQHESLGEKKIHVKLFNTHTHTYTPVRRERKLNSKQFLWWMAL